MPVNGSGLGQPINQFALDDGILFSPDQRARNTTVEPPDTGFRIISEILGDQLDLSGFGFEDGREGYRPYQFGRHGHSGGAGQKPSAIDLHFKVLFGCVLSTPYPPV